MKAPQPSRFGLSSSSLLLLWMLLFCLTLLLLVEETTSLIIVQSHHHRGGEEEEERRQQQQGLEDDEYTGLSEELFDKAAEYWIQALELAPDNYPGARNWLKVTGRLKDD